LIRQNAEGAEAINEKNLRRHTVDSFSFYVDTLRLSFAGSGTEGRDKKPALNNHRLKPVGWNYGLIPEFGFKHHSKQLAPAKAIALIGDTNPV
jgi:hypothetical protein